LVRKAWRKSVRFGAYLERLAAGRNDAPAIEPLPQDHRFDAPEWQQLPYAAWYQFFLLLQQWWHNATVDTEGVSDHHQDAVAFAARQALDMMSPSNFPATNPEVINATIKSGGMNFLRGFQNFLEDW